MRIRVYAPAILDHSLLDHEGYLQAEDGVTLKKIYGLLKVPLLLRPILYCTVNYDRVKMNTRLKDGDVISFIAPVSGG